MRVPLPAAMMTTSTGTADGELGSDETEWDMTKRSFRLRIIVASLALLLLGGCSVVRLGYEQLPLLLQTWVDRQVDLSDTQAAAVRRAADELLDWHRREQLPLVADWLAQLQSRALRDTDEAQLCRDAQWIRDRVSAINSRLLAPATDLAMSISPPQVARLQSSQQRSTVSWREEWLDGNARERLQRRTDRTIERAERVYGRLSTAQRTLIADWLANDGFDAAAWGAERRRREDDMTQTLHRLATTRPGPAQSRLAIAALLDRWQTSPDLAWRATSERHLRNGCILSARLHNSTSPEQRERAIRTLRGWESDLRALAGQSPAAAAGRAISPGTAGG